MRPSLDDDPATRAPTADRPRISSGDPATWAAGLATLAGVGFVVLGAWLLIDGSELPLALMAGLILIGGVQICCAYYSLRRVRAAWAFALSVNGTAFVIFLFGAPKLRDAASIPIAAALVPAIAFALITTLYALSAEEY